VSWCEAENPFIVPRILQSDRIKAAVASLGKLAVDCDGEELSAPCSMVRFFAALDLHNGTSKIPVIFFSARLDDQPTGVIGGFGMDHYFATYTAFVADKFCTTPLSSPSSNTALVALAGSMTWEPARRDAPGQFVVLLKKLDSWGAPVTCDPRCDCKSGPFGNVRAASACPTAANLSSPATHASTACDPACNATSCWFSAVRPLCARAASSTYTSAHGVMDFSGLSAAAMAAEMAACGNRSHSVVGMDAFPPGTDGETVLALLVKVSGSGSSPASYYLQFETLLGEEWQVDRTEVLEIELGAAEAPVQGEMRLQVLSQGRNCSLGPTAATAPELVLNFGATGTGLPQSCTLHTQLVVLSDEARVTALDWSARRRRPPSAACGSPQQRQSLEFGGAHGTFFRAKPGAMLDAAHIFGPGQQVLEATPLTTRNGTAGGGHGGGGSLYHYNASAPLRAQPLWLLLAVRSPAAAAAGKESAQLGMIGLPEFSMDLLGDAFFGALPPTLDDPAARRDSELCDAHVGYEDPGLFRNAAGACAARPGLYVTEGQRTVSVATSWASVSEATLRVAREYGCTSLGDAACIDNAIANATQSSQPPAAGALPAGLPELPDGQFEPRQGRTLLQVATHTREVQLFSLGTPPAACNRTTVCGDDPSCTNAWAAQPGSGDNVPATALQVTNLTRLSVIGAVRSLQATSNQQYLYTGVSRQRWELDSIARHNAMCARLATNPGDPYLEPQAASLRCKHAAAPDITAFMQVASACLPQAHCPTFSTPKVGIMETGFYSQYGFDKVPCPAGSTCNFGQKQLCPIGFICPSQGMSVPQRCPPDPTFRTTCSVSGLSAVQPCPDGTLCIAPYYPQLPAPPGYMTNDSFPRRNASAAAAAAAAAAMAALIAPTDGDALALGLLKCARGTWCGIGRSSAMLPSALLCPAGSVCAAPDALEPTFCDGDGRCFGINASYGPGGSAQACKGHAPTCPAGSSEERQCPAGFFCEGPIAKVQCAAGAYCPAGGVLWQHCDAGFYCPIPSQHIECPAGSFCPAGATAPIECAPLSHCPAGSAKQSTVLMIVMVLVLVPLLAYAGYALSERKKQQWRDEREAMRQVRSGHGGGGHDGRSAYSSEVQAQRRKQRSWASHALSALKQPRGMVATPEELELQADLPDSGAVYEEMGDEQLQSSGAGSSSVAEHTPAPLARKNFTIDFTFNKLGLELKSSKVRVLNDVTGSIRHGRITAVMGPSGAGKTTFLTTLANKSYYGRTLGEVLINGKRDSLNRHRKIVGFVPQEDVMKRGLTVKENLVFAAEARLPRDAGWTAQRRREHVHSVIVLLGLYEIRHSVIGDETTRGISGGQRKRVNIGIEMVADPTVLFLDEPTSGYVELEVGGVVLDRCCPPPIVRRINSIVPLAARIAVHHVARTGSTRLARWRCAPRCAASQIWA
jgi:ABC-type nitrate/sulfonate/bicarbonate transport system ATPase subunit